ncbi:putative reverse transcriptase/RNA-dependent DNA polymerase [Citrus sinensis]|uniref:Reverse transcriptase/RNA-dependent DNA polymerase n=1 Tax=Citrus sinensis TaxID=2711 RepID=A0ACB8JWG9_CITSI|nr:putative reverse transcriptase/RNA-dependent DNA polymerase [Citrus sinensis]
MVAKVLKARYFKGTDFLRANLGSNPSFIWRSILWGRQIINKGLRWRIGDGRSAQIYHSRWIPRPKTFKPFSPPKLPLESTVSELIDVENQWKELLVQQSFVEEDVQQILRIPLPRNPSPDQPLWHFDKRGEYTVKSGYQVALNQKFPDQLSSSKRNQTSWSIIWNTELPEKIKIFMWRMVKNLLPTTTNLWRRKVLQSPWCQRCQRTEETMAHAIFKCKVVQKIWSLTDHVSEIREAR